MSQERAKPFVAHMSHDGIEAALRGDSTYYNIYLHLGRASTSLVPVVITPLLPDDPKIDETWHDKGHGVHTILSAPYDVNGTREVVTEQRHPHTPDSRSWQRTPVEYLHRPPALKTFRLDRYRLDKTLADHAVEIRAESKEAALAKLAESLEEVP